MSAAWPALMLHSRARSHKQRQILPNRIARPYVHTGKTADGPLTWVVMWRAGQTSGGVLAGAHSRHRFGGPTSLLLQVAHECREDAEKETLGTICVTGTRRACTQI